MIVSGQQYRSVLCVGAVQRASRVLMGTGDARVDREQVLQLHVTLGRGGPHGREHPHIGAAI